MASSLEKLWTINELAVHDLIKMRLSCGWGRAAHPVLRCHAREGPERCG